MIFTLFIIAFFYETVLSLHICLLSSVKRFFLLITKLLKDRRLFPLMNSSKILFSPRIPFWISREESNSRRYAVFLMLKCFMFYDGFVCWKFLINDFNYRIYFNLFIYDFDALPLTCSILALYTGLHLSLIPWRFAGGDEAYLKYTHGVSAWFYNNLCVF